MGFRSFTSELSVKPSLRRNKTVLFLLAYMLLSAPLLRYHIFYLLGSCVLLGAGLWLHLSDRLEESARPAFLSAAGLCLGAGSVSVLLAFLGCCGAWFHNKRLLTAYFSLLVVLFILEMVAGTLGFFFRQQVADTLREELKAGIRDYYKPGNAVSDFWNHVQKKFDCCGVEGVKDWLEARHRPPDSCCNLPKTNTSLISGFPCVEDWHQKGCLRRVQGWLLERLYVVAAVCISLAFVQLFGLVSALLLACTVSQHRH